MWLSISHIACNAMYTQPVICCQRSTYTTVLWFAQPRLHRPDSTSRPRCCGTWHTGTQVVQWEPLALLLELPLAVVVDDCDDDRQQLVLLLECSGTCSLSANTNPPLLQQS